MSASIRVDTGQHLRQQEGVVVVEVAVERLLEPVILVRIRPAASWASTLGSRSPGDQRGQHRPAGDPEDVGGHHARA